MSAGVEGPFGPGPLGQLLLGAALTCGGQRPRGRPVPTLSVGSNRAGAALPSQSCGRVHRWLAEADGPALAGAHRLGQTGVGAGLYCGFALLQGLEYVGALDPYCTREETGDQAGTSRLPGLYGRMGATGGTGLDACRQVAQAGQVGAQTGHLEGGGRNASRWRRRKRLVER